MPLKYMKRCASLLLVRPTQNKTTPGYYSSSLRLAKVKMLANTPLFNAGGVPIFLAI